MRKLALQLCLASSAVLIIMTILCAVTGASQEAHEHYAPPDAYAAGLLAHAGALRVVFGLDVAFLVLYTLLFAALAAHLRARGASVLLLGVALGALLGTCVLDIIEDHHILALLGLAEAGRPIDDSAIAWQEIESATKFSLSYLGLVGLALAIPRDRALGIALAAVLGIGSLANAILGSAAPPAWREQLDSGRWIGFLVGFALTALWLRGEPDPAVSSTS